MSALRGPGTLTYDDGGSFIVHVDIEFPEGKGEITAAKMVQIAERQRPGRLHCGHITVSALVTDGHPNGNGHIVICGKPVIS